MNKAISFILENELVHDNDFVVIALSGGPDSMFLLQVLLEIRKKVSINIVCAHVNHNVRIESNDEQIFVEEYCKSHNVIFEYMKIEEYEKGNFEMIARKKRYDFFEQVLNKYDSKSLFVAHHGDDLIETIMMRIVRGTYTNGYIGFKKILDLDKYKIIRPLIYNTKEEILNYLNLNNIPYALDKSNDNLKYTRNRFRHKILPILKEENKSVHLKFLKFSENIIEYTEYIDRVSNEVINKVYNNNILDINLFLKEDIVIQKRVLNLILKSIYGNNINMITDTHIYNIINVIKSGKPNIRYNLPNKIELVKEYDTLKINSPIFNSNVYKIPLDKDVILPNNKKISYVTDELSDSNFVCRLNSKDIVLPLYVRCKKDGDRMYIKNLGGSKKLKDIFINEKISIEKRSVYPVVVDSNDNIVWLPGLKKSKYDKEINEKYDIILKYS